MGFFDKIKAGLTKTREALSGTLGSVFSGFSEIDDDFYDELEESLILADLGVDTSVKAVGRLRKAVREQHLKTTEEAREALKEILVDMLSVGDTELNLSTQPQRDSGHRRQRRGQDHHHRQDREAADLVRERRSCWWRETPSGRRPPISWKSGRAEAARPLSASTRARTRPPWCLTASSPPRPGTWT